MRENAYSSLNNGLPSEMELRLLLCRSTNLSKNELDKVKNNILAKK